MKIRGFMGIAMLCLYCRPERWSDISATREMRFNTAHHDCILQEQIFNFEHVLAHPRGITSTPCRPKSRPFAGGFSGGGRLFLVHCTCKIRTLLEFKKSSLQCPNVYRHWGPLVYPCIDEALTLPHAALKHLSYSPDISGRWLVSISSNASHTMDFI